MASAMRRHRPLGRAVGPPLRVALRRGRPRHCRREVVFACPTRDFSEGQSLCEETPAGPWAPGPGLWPRPVLAAGLTCRALLPAPSGACGSVLKDGLGSGWGSRPRPSRPFLQIKFYGHVGTAIRSCIVHDSPQSREHCPTCEPGPGCFWPPGPRPAAPSQTVSPQGRLTGLGGEDLPTIVIVAHYDAFGVAPVRMRVPALPVQLWPNLGGPRGRVFS